MTAALPLRVVVGAYELIEGALLWKNLYNRPVGVGKQADLAPLEEMHSPFGGWRHHLPPTSWWDYGCLVMELCLYRKA